MRSGGPAVMEVDTGAERCGDAASHLHCRSEEAVTGGDAKRLRKGSGDDDHHQYMDDDDDYGDDEPPSNPLDSYREDWVEIYGKTGSFEDETEILPMRHTDGPIWPESWPMNLLQIFSVKVVEVMGDLQWPLDVYGVVAVRDSLDRKRNILFCRERDDCQTLLQACPSRAVVVLDPVVFEVDLKVKVEATIIIHVVQGSTDFRARFSARTAGIDEDVVLLDSGDRKVVVADDGLVVLQRRVVVVEEKGKLNLRVEASENGSDTVVGKQMSFSARPALRSEGRFVLGFCTMSVIVACNSNTNSNTPKIRKSNSNTRSHGISNERSTLPKSRRPPPGGVGRPDCGEHKQRRCRPTPRQQHMHWLPTMSVRSDLTSRSCLTKRMNPKSPDFARYVVSGESEKTIG
ncbi:Os03g0150700 [Oryza sativa Japonica Group]|uniref:Os03g0150700 protein n=1 Tax=Oryza sativa subsp. japonica TaxID=39947 RepID=A0A0P0VT20_ORYSJ|nr:Os03g0150700 [Oryza sativa Japonica Group]